LARHTLTLPQASKQVLGPDLNRSESRRGALHLPCQGLKGSAALQDFDPAYVRFVPKADICGAAKRDAVRKIKTIIWKAP